MTVVGPALMSEAQSFDMSAGWLLGGLVPKLVECFEFRLADSIIHRGPARHSKAPN